MSGLTNTLPRSSCGKCVGVLKELISGLDDRDNSNRSSRSTRLANNNNSSSSSSNAREPAPLTLLRAIARSSEEHPNHDRWGRAREEILSRYRGSAGRYGVSNNAINNKNNDNDDDNATPGTNHPLLRIEETEDGVRLTIPVETTAPALMKRWTQLEPQEQQQEQEEDEAYNNHQERPEDWIPLATSVTNRNINTADAASATPATQSDEESPSLATTTTAPTIANPLTIELLCRKCEAHGPEAGARAFLMGPEPLSIVLCHNRIDSESDEVEEILTHELVHLYDVQTLGLDLSDCETVAYSEVRAAREAECNKEARKAAAAMAAANDDSNATTATSELPPESDDDDGLFAGTLRTTHKLKESFSRHVYKPYCVRKIALGATQNMFPSTGRSCLNRVWESAYGDDRPFPASSSSKRQAAGRMNTATGTMAERGGEGGLLAREESNGDGTNSGTIHGTSGK